MFGKFIYFSSDGGIYDKQKCERMKINESRSAETISDAVGVAVLVEFIKSPEVGLFEIRRSLKRNGIDITEILLKNFLEYHGILKKNEIYGSNNSALAD